MLQLIRRSSLLLVLSVIYPTPTTNTSAEETVPVVVTIDATTQRFLGDESAFDRSKFINVHSDYSGSYAFTPADANLLVNHYGVGFGRFFNSPFNFYRGDPPYPTREMLEALAPDRKWSKLSNANADFHTTRRIVTEHPRVAFRINKDYADAARFAADYFELMYDDTNRPDYYEPMNEPFVHAGDFGEDQECVRSEMAKFIGAIGREFDQRSLSTKVVGYASAWPSMELWDFGHWNSRMKMFMDTAGDHVDAISVHPYDGTNVTGQNNRRSGSNVEAILDLIETYGYVKWGKPKPHAITEYGDIPKGFDPEYSPASASAHLNSLNHLTFGFLDRQDRIEIAIPFITTKSPWFYNSPENNFQPYGVDLWRPDKSTIVDGKVKGFLRTEKFFFYDLWKDVEGSRALAYSDDPDVYVHAFVDGKNIWVCLNNLESNPRSIAIQHADELPAGTTTHVRRLYVPVQEAATYVEEEFDRGITQVTLAPHESVILRYGLKDAVNFAKKVVSRSHYSETHLQEIHAHEPITFTFSDVPTGNGRAMLRMGLGRKHDVSKQPAAEINGQRVEVPDDWPGYDQANRSDFFGTITVPVPIEALDTNTQVTVTFPDTGGRVSSMILVTELEEDLTD